MAYINIQEANAWTDKSKLNLETLDVELEKSLASQVLARVSQVYDVSSWVDSNSTPQIIRKIIAMLYVAWHYERVYSEDSSTSDYGIMLMDQAEALLNSIADGVIQITDIPVIPSPNALAGTPGFQSSEPVFAMGTIW